MLLVLDLSILFAGWLLAQIAFNGYEAHVPLPKRVAKFGAIFIIFLAVHYFVGRILFYGLLVLMTLGISVLHGYWFHVRHGIHWRTAEPRDKYLGLIGEKQKPHN